MTDTNDSIRAVLLKGLLSPWVGLAFLAGFIVGYVAKAMIGA